MSCYDIVSGYVQRALAWTSKPKQKVLQYFVIFYYVLLFMLGWLCLSSLNRKDTMSRYDILYMFVCMSLCNYV